MRLQIKQVPSDPPFTEWVYPVNTEIKFTVLQVDGCGMLHYTVKPPKAQIEELRVQLRENSYLGLNAIVSEVIRRECACGVDGVLIVTGQVMDGKSYIPLVVKYRFQSHKAFVRVQDNITPDLTCIALHGWYNKSGVSSWTSIARELRSNRGD